MPLDSVCLHSLLKYTNTHTIKNNLFIRKKTHKINNKNNKLL